jgi:hypothetical protein
MENNIFIKMKKEKFNPDIEPKLKNKEVERDNTKFEMSNLIYNPITGIIPEKINNINDLVICKDNSLDKVDIKKLILEKEKERSNQDNQYKPVQTKVINNNPVVQSNKINSTQNYIETYEELKRGSQNKSNQQSDNKVKNYDNILEGLKDLGIIKL